MKRLVVIFTLLLMSAAANAKVVSKQVIYRDGDTKLVGTFVYDDAAKGRHPGIVLVHDIWGPDALVRNRAFMLARLGYVAMVADLYGAGVKADSLEVAQDLATKLRANLKRAESRFKAAEKALKARKNVDPRRIAAIGYGLGGEVVIDMARLGLKLRAVASFYGNLATDHPARKGKVKARILVVNGALDPMVDPKQVEAIKAEMKKAGATLYVMNFPTAKHAFTDPQADQLGRMYKLPLAYNAIADQASWRSLLAMLHDTLK